MRLQIPNIMMGYEDSGSPGSTSLPVILFIHGNPLSRKLWQPQLTGLADSARVLSLDLRGFGESDSTSGPYSMEMLADDCMSFLDHLGISKPVIICGLSMGGYIAFTIYRIYPKRVRGLILADTRAAADSLDAKKNRDRTILLVEKEGVEAIVRLMLPQILSPNAYTTRPELVDQVRKIMHDTTVPGLTGVLAGMRDRLDSTDLLTTISAPTLLLFGEEDQLASKPEIESMHMAIIGSQLHWIPQAGHLPNLEQPEIFNSHVKQFLTSFTDK